MGGGYKNRVEFGSYSVIAGGDQNLIEGGGWYNTISGGSVSEILGGAQAATIGGGFDHYVPGGGDYATIPGGLRNAATNHAFAAGRRAKALNTGAFVWGDATDADVSSTANNQVTFRASGGFRVLNGELLVEQGLRVSNAGTVFARVQAGTTTLGPGTNTMSYVVAFPSAFVTAPKVQVTPRNDPLFDVPDTFATTLRKVTTTNFVVNIHRVDAPAGWAQQLRLDWTAWE